MGKQRVTKHSARTHKNGGAFSPKHNDRNYENDLDNSKNLYWSCYSNGWYAEFNKSEKLSFEEVELTAYKELFSEFYELQMDKHRQSGHLERVKPFEDWIKAKQYLPEECYIQIGKMGKHVTATELQDVMQEFFEWEDNWNAAHGYPFQRLDVAYHGGEAVPQYHIRRVWLYEDADGILKIGQDKALEQAGIELPDPTKKRSRYNNRKQVFDAESRKVFMDICERHGIEIEREPLPDGKHNREKEQVIADKYQDMLDDMEKLEARKLDLESEVDTLEANKINRQFTKLLQSGIEDIKNSFYDARRACLECEMAIRTRIKLNELEMAKNDVLRVKSKVAELRDAYQDELSTMSYEKAQAIRNRNIGLEEKYAELLEKTEGYDYSFGK